jgi:hypothetical protein
MKKIDDYKNQLYNPYNKKDIEDKDDNEKK